MNRPEVVDESVDGEVLIVHLGTGAYYSSRGTGDAIWQLIASGATAAEAAAAVANGSGSDRALRSVGRFVAQLAAEGLIRPRNAPPVGAPPVEAAGPFTEPELEKFTDMQELLLLDPIHDVDDATGWPNVPPGGTGV